ncbi:MAG: hypothetical protein FJ264_01380 [Planctomycetes bacterium]|nr:hypothetical protein [Planctomycetota bacterium]
MRYWQRVINITTQLVTVPSLNKIHGEMKPDESLMIYCKSFQEAYEKFRLTIITCCAKGGRCAP